MSLSFGQCGAGDIGTGTSVTSASKTTSTTGSAFLICTSGKSAAINAVPTDSFGNTYTLLASSIGGVFGSDNAYIYACFGGTGGTGHTATAVYAATTPADVHLIEVPGASALDVAAPATTNTSGSATTLAGAPITTVAAATAVVSYYAGYGGGSNAITDTGTGFSILTQTGGTSTVNSAVSGRIVSSAGTYQDTYTITAFDYGAFLTVSLKALGAALAGAANDATTAAGDVKTAARLAGAAADTTSASGTLPTPAVAGSAADTTTAAGALSTAIRLAGAAADTTSASAAIAVPQPTIGAHTVTTATTATTVTTSAVTTQAAASTFVITAHSRGASNVPPTSVSDSFGNTYTLKESNTSGGYGDIWVGMYVCDGGTGGAGHTATVVWSAAPQISALYLTEILNLANPSFDVGNNTFSNAGAETYPGASVTTVNANDIILSLWGGQSGGSSAITDSGAGFSILDQTGGGSAVINSALSVSTVSAVGTYQDTYVFSVYDYGGFTAIALKAKPSGGAAAALAGAASDATTATAALTTAGRLASAATDTTTAIGAITTSINLASAATNAIAAAATLTNFTSVTLAAPLYTGIGGALDPNFWLDNVPVAGDTLWYDPTYITIATSGEISATTNNCSAVVQFNDGTGLALGLIVITPQMVGYATDATMAAGSLGGANLASAAISVATAAGVLSTNILMSAAATDVVTAAAALTIGAHLASAASDVTSATASMLTAIYLVAAASNVTSAAGQLSGGPSSLAGSATDSTTASGLLTAQIRLASAAADTITAIGALSTKIQLVAAAMDSTTATATMAGTSAPLAGSAADSATATGTLSTRIQLAATALDTSSATGALSSATQFAGTGVDLTAAAAALVTGIRLAATAADLTSALATLTGAHAQLSGAASDQLSAVASLTSRILLFSAADDTDTASANLATQIMMLSAANDAIAAGGSLSTGGPKARNGRTVTAQVQLRTAVAASRQ